MKNRLDTVKRRVYSSQWIRSLAFRKRRQAEVSTCHAVLKTPASTLKIESPGSSPEKVNVDLSSVDAASRSSPSQVNVDLSSVGAGQGGVGFPTPPTAESPVSRIQQNLGPCMVSGVGFPTPLMETSDCLSSPVSLEILALTQLPQNSVSSQSPDFVPISRDFTESSKNCSPDELSVLELRGSGFTPHKKIHESLRLLTVGKIVHRSLDRRLSQAVQQKWLHRWRVGP